MAKKIDTSFEAALKDSEIALEEFAVAIEKISNGMDALLSSRLKYSTILMLIARASGVNQAMVERVLLAIPELRKKFLKP